MKRTTKEKEMWEGEKWSLYHWTSIMKSFNACGWEKSSSSPVVPDNFLPLYIYYIILYMIYKIEVFLHTMAFPDHLRDQAMELFQSRSPSESFRAQTQPKRNNTIRSGEKRERRNKFISCRIERCINKGKEKKKHVGVNMQAFVCLYMYVYVYVCAYEYANIVDWMMTMRPPTHKKTSSYTFSLNIKHHS